MIHDLLIDAVLIILFFFANCQLSPTILSANSPISFRVGAGVLAGIFSLVVLSYAPDINGIQTSFSYLPLLLIGHLGGGYSILSSVAVFSLAYPFLWGFGQETAVSVGLVIVGGLVQSWVTTRVTGNWKRWFASYSTSTILIVATLGLYFSYRGMLENYVSYTIVFVVASFMIGTTTIYLLNFVHSNKRLISQLKEKNDILELQHWKISKTTNELQQSEQQLEGVLNSITDCFFALDQEFRIIYLNESASELLGSKEHSLGKKIHELYPFILKTRVYQELQRSLNEKKTIDVTHYSANLNKWYMVRIFPREQGLSIYYKDVTKEKLAENELLTTKEKFQNVLESVKEVIYQTDANGRIIFLNPAWEEVTSYTIEESLQHNYARFVHEEDRARVVDTFHSLIERKKTYTRQVIRYVTKMGQLRWLEGNVRLSYNEEGNFLGAFGTLSDITKRHESEELLRVAMKRLKNMQYALDESSIVAITDARGMITHVNDQFCRISGFSKEEVLGKTHRLVNSGHHSKEFMQNLWQTVKRNEIWRGEVKNRAKDGTYYWVDTVIVPLTNERNEIYELITFRTDITNRKLAEEKLVEANTLLQQLSSRDGLTGIYNRRAFDEKLAQVWEEAIQQQSPLAAIMIDVDHFKLYNDFYGHLQGDECLKLVANTITGCLRQPHDFGARYGGEEFVVLLPHTCQEHAVKMAESIRTAILEKAFPHQRSLVQPIVTSSLGVATVLPTAEMKASDLVEMADQALYKAKRDGRNQVQTYGEDEMPVAKSVVAAPNPDFIIDPVQEYINHLHAGDDQTWEHSNRVAHFAIMLAEELGMSEEDREKLYVTSLLHDIGKLDIPKSILHKTSRLSKEEFEIIMQHPRLGVEKMHRHGDFPLKEMIIEGILYHHERWNGTGYPYRLTKEQIPFTARLLGIVDSFSAMTEERVYKNSMPIEDALNEIESKKEVLYDPKLVDIFVQAMRKRNDLKNIV